jgi:hypothetical protein
MITTVRAVKILHKEKNTAAGGWEKGCSDTGCISELGDFAILFFSGLAILGRMPL